MGLLLGLTIAAPAGAQPLLRIGIHDAEPVAFLDDAGQPTGFSVEILEHIAEHERWRLEYVACSWTECLELLEAGEIDLLFPIRRTPEREARFDFTNEAMFSSWGRVFARRGSTIESVLDLNGRTIAGVQNDAFFRDLENMLERFDVQARFMRVETAAEIVDLIIERRVDAGVIENLGGHALIRGKPVEPTPIVFSPAFPYIATTKGANAEALAAIDRHLAQMRRDPDSFYYRAHEAWFVETGAPKIPVWLVWSASALGIALLVAGVFAMALRMEVRSKTSELRTQNKQLEHEMLERAQLEIQLRQSQKMEAIGTLAAGIAHDFNNVLTAIRGHTDMARSSLVDGDLPRDALAGIEEAAAQGIDVTRALLTFSRRTDATMTPVRLADVIERSLTMARSALRSHVEVEMAFSDTQEHSWIMGDQVQLQQMMLNLALNARDAMPEGGTLRISVDNQFVSANDEFSSEFALGDRIVKLTIEDDGVGMTDDVRTRIFDPFFTTKMREHGTGLGLSIVHGIVLAHHGAIDVASSPEGGTCVRITFPMTNERPIARMHNVSAPTSITSGDERSGELRASILLVEDNAQVRAILASTLRRAGHQVIPVADGAAALACVDNENTPIDLALVDIDLQEVDRIGLVRRLRTSQPGSPIIVMSGPPQSPASDGALSGVRFLPKPFEMDALLNSVRESLASARLTDH